MSTLATVTESQHRLYDKLYRDLGNEVLAYLTDPDLTEVLANPDGGLWVDSSTRGQQRVGSLTRHQRLAIIHDVAGINHHVINETHPHVEATLPHFKLLKGQRFTAIVPPVAAEPCFTIRKRSEVTYTLDDYANSGRLTGSQATVLRHLIRERRNILVCGGPGSGKTTFTNALISEAVHCDPNQRFLILEDTPELQCSALNQASLLTSSRVSMTQLLRLAMRFRPDRILIGEVRGGEALDLLKAWNTGCPGGIATVHANGTEEAVQRMLDLSMEAGLATPPHALVKHTIDAVIFVTRKHHQKGFVQHITQLGEHQHGHITFETLA